jgi:hypothetical protein
LQGSMMRLGPEWARDSVAVPQQPGQISGAPCENVRLNMYVVQPFSSQKTSNTQRSTLNVERSIFFCIQCWTLDVGRWTLASHLPGGVAERLIAPVLKTGRPKGLVSSNLTPSGFQFSILEMPLPID